MKTLRKQRYQLPVHMVHLDSNGALSHLHMAHCFRDVMSLGFTRGDQITLPGGNRGRVFSSPTHVAYGSISATLTDQRIWHLFKWNQCSSLQKTGQWMKPNPTVQAFLLPHGPNTGKYSMHRQTNRFSSTPCPTWTSWPWRAALATYHWLSLPLLWRRSPWWTWGTTTHMGSYDLQDTSVA